MDKNKIVDGILFYNQDNPNETIIFNFHTWVEVIKAIMMLHIKKSESEIESIILSSPLIERALDGYTAVVVRCHELEYHWAMVLAYGDKYWLNNISQDEPENYFEWEEKYREDHYLAKESFEFSD